MKIEKYKEKNWIYYHYFNEFQYHHGIDIYILPNRIEIGYRYHNEKKGFYLKNKYWLN